MQHGLHCGAAADANMVWFPKLARCTQARWSWWPAPMHLQPDVHRQCRGEWAGCSVDGVGAREALDDLAAGPHGRPARGQAQAWHVPSRRLRSGRASTSSQPSEEASGWLAARQVDFIEQ